jgi:hypothetical protein
MQSPFDGAGDPYRGSSPNGWLVAGIVCIVVIAMLWLAFSGALELLPAAA